MGKVPAYKQATDAVAALYLRVAEASGFPHKGLMSNAVSFQETSLAKVRAYYTQALGCLNKAWAPAIRKAGYQFWAPQLQVYSGKSSTSPSREFRRLRSPIFNGPCRLPAYRWAE